MSLDFKNLNYTVKGVKLNLSLNSDSAKDMFLVSVFNTGFCMFNLFLTSSIVDTNRSNKSNSSRVEIVPRDLRKSTSFFNIEKSLASIKIKQESHNPI